jgi:mRNA deadenylase 3'-5' endonuclease subunit Ccr4
MDDQVDESHALLPLVSAYGRTSGEPECTSFHGGFQGTVDYILFTESQFSVISKLPTPSRGELRRRRSLPDMAMPSDHVPIAADLEWQVEF